MNYSKSDRTIANKLGWTPLHLVGRPDIAQLLINPRSLLEVKDSFGMYRNEVKTMNLEPEVYKKWSNFNTGPRVSE